MQRLPGTPLDCNGVRGVLVFVAEVIDVGGYIPRSMPARVDSITAATIYFKAGAPVRVARFLSPVQTGSPAGTGVQKGAQADDRVGCCCTAPLPVGGKTLPIVQARPKHCCGLPGEPGSSGGAQIQPKANKWDR